MSKSEEAEYVSEEDDSEQPDYVPEESANHEASTDTKGDEQAGVEEDMEMLKRLLAQVENGETKNVQSREERVRAAYAESQMEPLNSQIAVSREEPEETFPDITYEAFTKEPEESEIELLEEFVQSFLA